MRIAQVAPLWIPVPPHTYGGIELVISWLSEELVRRGHKVTLFASGDSKTSAELVPVWPKSLWRARLATPHAAFSLLYHQLLKRKGDFDIVHDHCEFYSVGLSRFLGRPVVSTIHHPMYPEMITLFKKYPNVNYVAISNSQRRSAPGVNFIDTIYHGLPFRKYPFNPQPENHLLWLSKITPEKGTAEAIEVAKKTGEKLILCGVIPKRFGDYFEYRVSPLIDGHQIQFVGAADFEKKIRLFQSAKAVLYPIKRQEPFGLVVIEAMACGTPVIAYNTGAMPELIEDGVNGFLVENQDEMAQAIQKINTIDREACSLYARKNFSLRKMVDKYEKLYQKILTSPENRER
jgi:glycosyltransferase involved in cell wall biosynthesis